MDSHLLALKGEVVYSKKWRSECLTENRECGRVTVALEGAQECQTGNPGLL